MKARARRPRCCFRIIFCNITVFLYQRTGCSPSILYFSKIELEADIAGCSRCAREGVFVQAREARLYSVMERWATRILKQMLNKICSLVTILHGVFSSKEVDNHYLSDLL